MWLLKTLTLLHLLNFSKSFTSPGNAFLSRTSTHLFFEDSKEKTEDIQLRKTNPKKPISDETPLSENVIAELNHEWRIQNEIPEVETSSIPIDQIGSRTVDTIEDIATILKRLPYEKGWFRQPPLKDRPTVVVLGSGWSSHALMKVADNSKIRLVVISKTNHFVFTPMLASASTGTIEYRSMTESIRASNPMIEYIEGEAIDIDVENKKVTVKLEEFLKDLRAGDAPTEEIAYDHLVVGVGCRVNDDIVPGASKYCLRLKTVNDSRRIRTAIGECLEYASRKDVADDPSLQQTERNNRKQKRRERTTFCIIGGGPTGVELAGELSDFMKYVTQPWIGAYRNLADDVRIMVIQGGSDLVPAFEQDLRNHALASLEKAGVEVRLNTRVQEVGDGYIKLKEKNSNTEETIASAVSIWAAGTAPTPFVSKLLEKLPEEAKARGGKVNVDRWLRCPVPRKELFGSILVLGDACNFESTNGSVLPQTAQVAGQEGAFAARLLCRGYDLSETPPILKEDTAVQQWLKFRGLEESPGFVFLNLGLLAYVGGGEALATIMVGDVPVLSYAGSIAFVLWRSVYLVKQVATRNRVLVTFDWLKCRIFGYDITRL